MSAPVIQDHPGTIASKFSASLVETPGLPRRLTVTGEAAGDYRIQDVTLVPARHQPSPHILVLDVAAKVGPVENPRPQFEKVWPPLFTEEPAKHRYTEVKIVNGGQHFLINVIFVL